MAGLTPSQTVGPWFAYGLVPNHEYDWSDLATGNLLTPDVAGERIHIEGRVFDGDGKPMPDAMIEIWQADSQGRYAHPRDNRALPNSSFKGFGRVGTNANGEYRFDTIKPGAVPGPNGAQQAPHILVAFYSRGLLTHMYTRIYFEGEKANDSDPILGLVPAERRKTLIAKKQSSGSEAVYQFDIRVQGGEETVFFEV